MPLPPEKSFPPDELDLKILARLRTDPRTLNKSLAEALGVTEATVGARIRSMENRGVMKLMAQRDFRSAGYHVLANVDVNVAGRPVNSVAQDLARLDGIGNLSTFMGDPSIMLLAMAGSLAELQTLVMDKIARVEGVRSVETMVFADIIKYESEFAQLRLAN